MDDYLDTSIASEKELEFRNDTAIGQVMTNSTATFKQFNSESLHQNNIGASFGKEEDQQFSIWDSTIILTSRAIGTGFLFFPSHLQYIPFAISKMNYITLQCRHVADLVQLRLRFLLFHCDPGDKMCTQRFLVSTKNS